MQENLSTLLNKITTELHRVEAIRKSSPKSNMTEQLDEFNFVMQLNKILVHVVCRHVLERFTTACFQESLHCIQNAFNEEDWDDFERSMNSYIAGIEMLVECTKEEGVDNVEETTAHS